MSNQTTRVKSTVYGAVRLKILAILSDGRPHQLEKMRSAIDPLIPSEFALRDSQRRRPIKPDELHHAISVGRRHIIARQLSNLLFRGVINSCGRGIARTLWIKEQES